MHKPMTGRSSYIHWTLNNFEFIEPPVWLLNWGETTSLLQVAHNGTDLDGQTYTNVDANRCQCMMHVIAQAWIRACSVRFIIHASLTIASYPSSYFHFDFRAEVGMEIGTGRQVDYALMCRNLWSVLVLLVAKQANRASYSVDRSLRSFGKKWDWITKLQCRREDSITEANAIASYP